MGAPSFTHRSDARSHRDALPHGNSRPTACGRQRVCPTCLPFKRWLRRTVGGREKVVYDCVVCTEY